MTTTPSFLGKNKVRGNFIWEKLIELLLFNEVLINLIFFQLPIKTFGFITLILSKFQIPIANICGQFIAKDFDLWSTLLFVRFEKLNFSKSSVALKKDPKNHVFDSPRLICSLHVWICFLWIQNQFSSLLLIMYIQNIA